MAQGIRRVRRAQSAWIADQLRRHRGDARSPALWTRLHAAFERQFPHGGVGGEPITLQQYKNHATYLARRKIVALPRVTVDRATAMAARPRDVEARHRELQRELEQNRRERYDAQQRAKTALLQSGGREGGGGERGGGLVRHKLRTKPRGEEEEVELRVKSEVVEASTRVADKPRATRQPDKRVHSQWASASGVDVDSDSDTSVDFVGEGIDIYPVRVDAPVKREPRDTSADESSSDERTTRLRQCEAALERSKRETQSWKRRFDELQAEAETSATRHAEAAAAQSPPPLPARSGQLTLTIRVNVDISQNGQRLQSVARDVVVDAVGAADSGATANAGGGDHQPSTSVQLRERETQR